jgi:hypothetical protein
LRGLLHGAAENSSASGFKRDAVRASGEKEGPAEQLSTAGRVGVREERVDAKTPSFGRCQTILKRIGFVLIGGGGGNLQSPPSVP